MSNEVGHGISYYFWLSGNAVVDGSRRGIQLCCVFSTFAPYRFRLGQRVRETALVNDGIQTINMEKSACIPLGSAK